MLLVTAVLIGGINATLKVLSPASLASRFTGKF